jgi:hypothetical protein
MIEIDSDSWDDFDTELREFFNQTPVDRHRFIFRGQADASWGLQSTLTRATAPLQDLDQSSFHKRLVEQFQIESARTSVNLPKFSNKAAWSLLARHHGVPSPILDWTRSPYIAQFFAAADGRHDQIPGPTRSAVWGLDLGVLEKLDKPSRSRITVIDSPSLVLRNRRAVEQQSVFLEVSPGWEDSMGDDLIRWTFPQRDRDHALVRLESMGITHTSLLRTLDAAARTARQRATALERNSDR